MMQILLGIRRIGGALEMLQVRQQLVLKFSQILIEHDIDSAWPISVHVDQSVELGAAGFTDSPTA